MLGAVILAGGHGRRMGGADKASLSAHGTRFIDRLLAQLPYGTSTVAVSPHRLGLPQVCETPLYGGPVAGIAAGTQALSHCSELALFAVDAPDSPQLLPHLRAVLTSSTADAVLTRAADGYLQPLCSLWHAPTLRAQLESLPTTRNVSVRRLIRGANFVEIPGTGAERDYDTRAELHELPQLCFPTTLRAHRQPLT
ncbi:NTP transferase domain-containing protein [uncultured Corynebacterium sp.]|uniref:molybdenum cofactor guanylyltransferase n=1 Tax=uncultured Corynebacterium sp. TaxID=159447 RepID=UPI0025F39D51|nr:NTP transferase domain-containing protein [uncultured Corynebacterium sp.]